jgi:DNA-binding response OmpR family regulator
MAAYDYLTAANSNETQQTMRKFSEKVFHSVILDIITYFGDGEQSMKQSKRILIIEDERDMARIISLYLDKQGYEAKTANTAVQGLLELASWQPHYIILDIGLPDLDGIEVCRRIRETSDVPVLILSARGSSTDKVLGLGFGADDYMTKPFELAELAARIAAYFRRHDGQVSSRKGEADAINAGPLSMNRKQYTAAMGGNELMLSAKEFELLYHLASHSNQVFSKSRLLDAVWGLESHGDENTVTVYIRRLREKLEADPSNPAYLITVWGVGYKFSAGEG